MSHCLLQAKNQNKSYCCAAAFFCLFFFFFSVCEHHSEVPTTYNHQIFIRVTVGRWQAYTVAILHQNICNLIKFYQ